MRITVFCSSSDAVPAPYRRIAHDLGQLMAQRGHSLVYGGATSGLMGTLARSVREAGGAVTGVMPRQMVAYGLAMPGLDRMVVTTTMAERKAYMEASADGFIVLPGGFGTLEELFEVLTLRQLGTLKGPVVLLSPDGFYDGLLDFFGKLYREQFAKEAFQGLYTVVAAPIEALDAIEYPRETSYPDKWF